MDVVETKVSAVLPKHICITCLLLAMFFATLPGILITSESGINSLIKWFIHVIPWSIRTTNSDIIIFSSIVVIHMNLIFKGIKTVEL